VQSVVVLSLVQSVVVLPLVVRNYDRCFPSRFQTLYLFLRFSVCRCTLCRVCRLYSTFRYKEAPPPSHRNFVSSVYKVLRGPTYCYGVKHFNSTQGKEALQRSACCEIIYNIKKVLTRN